jgi:hypothetical protein
MDTPPFLPLIYELFNVIHPPSPRKNARPKLFVYLSAHPHRDIASIPPYEAQEDSLSSEPFAASWTPTTVDFYRTHGRLFPESTGAGADEVFAGTGEQLVLLLKFRKGALLKSARPKHPALFRMHDAHKGSCLKFLRENTRIAPVLMP